jgi:hypothetical protein
MKVLSETDLNEKQTESFYVSLSSYTFNDRSTWPARVPESISAVIR